MKAQFKYAFLAGFYVRLPVFAVIFIMNTVFITLGSLGLLPFAAHVTAVSLGGVAIAVMMAADIISDVIIIRRMFFAPVAYLHALTPVPRGKILFASVIAMAVMDLISMAVVISSEVWLSFNLAGSGVGEIFWSTVLTDASIIVYSFLSILLLIACYFLVVMVVLFSIAMKKSIFYKMPASGFMAFLAACGCFYIVSLLQLLLSPFSEVQRYGLLFILNLGGGVTFPLYILLTLLEAIALFILTSKLLERKINI